MVILKFEDFEMIVELNEKEYKLAKKVLKESFADKFSRLNKSEKYLLLYLLMKCNKNIKLLTGAEWASKNQGISFMDSSSSDPDLVYGYFNHHYGDSNFGKVDEDSDDVVLSAVEGDQEEPVNEEDCSLTDLLNQAFEDAGK